VLFLAFFVITAIDLFRSYQSHANIIPEHARIKVVGEVVQANTVMGWRYFTFRTDAGEQNVACVLEKTEIQNILFRSVRAGKNVTASGIFDGHKDHIRLNNCRIEVVGH
jgi:hypothetical protein